MIYICNPLKKTKIPTSQLFSIYFKVNLKLSPDPLPILSVYRFEHGKKAVDTWFCMMERVLAQVQLNFKWELHIINTLPKKLCLLPGHITNTTTQHCSQGQSLASLKVKTLKVIQMCT